MKTSRSFTIYFLMAFLVCAVWAPPACAQSPDATSVLAAAKAASGGDAWDAIRTLHIQGFITKGGISSPYEEWDDVMTGHNASQYPVGLDRGANGFDGKISWNQDQTGQSRVEGDSDSRQSDVSYAYFTSCSFWFPSRVPGTVAYARRVMENNRSFDILRISPNGGYTFDLWIDTATHLIDRKVKQGAEQTRTSFYSDYRLVSGVLMPFMLRVSNGQTRYDQIYTSQTVEANVLTPASRFALPPPPAPDFTFEDGKTSTTVPYTYSHNHIYFSVTINGQGPFSALLDTGGSLILSASLARRLTVRPEGVEEATGVGEKSVDAGSAQVEAVRIGSIHLIRPIFFVIPMAIEEEHPIAGYQLFSRFVVTIDADKNLLTLTLPEAFVYHGKGIAVPFRLNGTIPELDGMVDGIPGVFMIDTGAADSLTLTSPFIARHHLKEKYHSKVTGIFAYGVGGPEYASLTHVHTLAFGGITAHDLVTELSLASKGTNANTAVSGTIGEVVLHRFNVTFDYSRQTIILEPNSHYHDPDVENRSGLTFDAADGSGLVVAVVPGGPAAQTGIKVGDTLLTIDGHSPAALPFGGARRLFQQPVGTKIRIRVRAGKSVRTVVITLRDLI